jgi:hypothetical protein
MSLGQLHVVLGLRRLMTCGNAAIHPVGVVHQFQALVDLFLRKDIGDT